MKWSSIQRFNVKCRSNKSSYSSCLLLTHDSLPLRGLCVHSKCGLLGSSPCYTLVFCTLKLQYGSILSQCQSQHKWSEGPLMSNRQTSLALLSSSFVFSTQVDMHEVISLLLQLYFFSLHPSLWSIVVLEWLSLSVWFVSLYLFYVCSTKYTCLSICVQWSPVYSESVVHLPFHRNVLGNESVVLSLSSSLSFFLFLSFAYQK